VSVSLAALALAACDGPEFPPEVEGNAFSIVVLPDTQGYTNMLNRDIFAAQTEWIAANQAAHNIKFVIHVGDVVEGSWLDEQWEIGRGAMANLDGVVPYIISPGNHDYGETRNERNARSRSTIMHHHFPREGFESMPSFGEFYPEADRIDNSFHTFSAGGEDWLVIALEFAPRDLIVEWAGEVIESHPAHRVIVATHAYQYWDNKRYDWETYSNSQEHSPKAYAISQSDEGANDGEQIFERLIAPHSNSILAVLSGHALGDGLGYSMSAGVHEILANFQSRSYGGNGYLRLMQFDPDTRRLKIFTFSPWRERLGTASDEQFEVDY